MILKQTLKNYKCTCICIGIINDCAVNPNISEHIYQDFHNFIYCIYMSGHRLASNGRTCDGKEMFLVKLK